MINTMVHTMGKTQPGEVRGGAESSEKERIPWKEKAGLSSGHVDPDHVWERFGLTMGGFRKDVKNWMEQTDQKYYIRKTWEEKTSQKGAYGVYEYESGKPLPEEYREVTRYLEGSFLFVLKNGPYNKIPGTYVLISEIKDFYLDCDAQ